MYDSGCNSFISLFLLVYILLGDFLCLSIQRVPRVQCLDFVRCCFGISNVEKNIFQFEYTTFLHALLCYRIRPSEKHVTLKRLRSVFEILFHTCQNFHLLPTSLVFYCNCHPNANHFVIFEFTLYGIVAEKIILQCSSGTHLIIKPNN